MKLFAKNYDQEDSDKESFLKEATINKYKIGRHHKMERFTISLLAAVCLLGSVTTISFAKDIGKKSEVSVEKARYSETLEYSKSGNTGTVEGVYLSENGKTGYVLLKMNDVANVSLDASSYMLFVRGALSKLSYEPTLYMLTFGSSGYQALVVHDEGGIRNQPLEITIRANKTLIENGKALKDNSYSESFKEFDQARLYVNPGATKATKSKTLNNADIGISDLYYELVAKYEDKAIHESVSESKAKIASLIERANEYNERIENLGFDAPEEPAWLSDDYVVPGGIDLNYNKDLSDGYVLQVVSSYSELSDYLKERDIDTGRKEDPVDIVELFSKSGGSLLLEDVYDGVSSEADLSLKSYSRELLTIWANILSEKTTLQRTTGRSMLMLDQNVHGQATEYSVGKSSNVVLW